ncbi:MAG TPA: hypothetical protein VL400_13475 [Polyangiaceae bacterium]|jgi:hypothetical protein|nr:hypothetical protein [Polyangiaceae bacterium]
MSNLGRQPDPDPGAKRPQFTIFGERASHPRARALAEAAHALLFRYASDVVAAYGLCPFLHNVETGMGDVGIVLDTVPSQETAQAAIVALGGPVIHLAYPLARATASEFERFGSKLAQSLRTVLPEPLVHATFHPELAGGRENAHRLIGLLRQSPDPFVQLIPPGMMKGGTVLVTPGPGGVLDLPKTLDIPQGNESRADAMYRRLMEGDVDRVIALLASMRAEREATYGALAREIAGA